MFRFVRGTVNLQRCAESETYSLGVMQTSALLSIGLLLLSSPAKPASLEIPFRWTPGQIEIQVSIEGKPPIWCLLDSGAEFSMIDAEVAKTLKLGPIVRRGSQERIENVTWDIGPLRMKGQNLTLWSLDNFRRQKREIRGVIGCEVFEKYVVTIDFQKKVITLNDPSTFRRNPAASEFPLTFDGRLPVIATQMKFGQRVVRPRLMIDTGASTAVILRHPYARENQLFGSGDKTTTSETVAVGARPFVTLSAREITLGRWTFPNPGVEAYGTPTGAGGYRSNDGVLGNKLLQHFRVTFDYARRRLYLEDTRRAKLP